MIQRSAIRMRKTSLLLIAVWFGLVTGFGEVCILMAKRSLGGSLIFFGQNVVWMAPLMNAILFALLGLAFLALGMVWRRFATLSLTTFVFAYWGYWALFLIYPRLHVLAAFLLVVGLALQTSRLIRTRSGGFQTLVRRSVGWLTALVLVLAAGVWGSQALADHRALHRETRASSGAPNVLLIVWDTVRARSVGLYGSDRPTTPNLERIATEGVCFDWAMSPAPWTLPTHASMFTGRFPNELSVGWYRPLDTSFPTIAEVLDAHGYMTAGFVANTTYCSYETGLGRGFSHYEDYTVSTEEIIRSSSLARFISEFDVCRRLAGFHNLLGRKSAARLNRDFLHWLERTDGRPFFAFLNYFDAHDPYFPPEPFDAKLGPRTPREKSLLRHWWNAEKDKLSPAEIALAETAYECSIAYLDHELNELLGALEERGVLDNTLIIITSDHGEQFGEHQLFSHGNSLYEPSLHVPLLILFPGRVPAGKRILQPVSLRDLPATVVDLLELDEGSRFPGCSLAHSWADRAETCSGPVLSEIAAPSRLPPDHGRSPVMAGPMQSILIGDMHYIRNEGSGSEELYNLRTDPLEEDNLAHVADNRRTFERLKLALDRQRPR